MVAIFNSGFSHYVIFLFQELNHKQPAAVDHDEEMDVEYLDFPVVNMYSEVIGMSCYVIINSNLFYISIIPNVIMYSL